MSKKKIMIDEYFNFNRDDIIVVGCSSGPDSMALMDMLLTIREKYSLKLICAHVNHNVRVESKLEEEYIREYCLENNLIFETMKIEKYGDDNFENEARNIRYHYFEELVNKYNANYLMTAHHGDDLIETILMRMVRGSNLGGYAGFKEYVDMGNYYLVRPLIFFTKEELVDYDLTYHIKYFNDSSNKKSVYTRNRYRKKVLPFLKEEEKNVHKKFLKFSRILQEVSLFVNKERDKVLKKVIKNGKISIEKFLEIDLFLQKEILYYLMQEFYQDDLILINDRHIELIFSVIKTKRSNMVVDLPNGVQAIKSYDVFYLKREMEELTCYEIELSEYAKLPNGHSIKKVDFIEDNSNNICRLSSDEIVLPLVVRTRKFGDKIYLKGIEGSKKIKDIFIDCKIPLESRDMWPIVEDGLGRIVWIPGLKKSKFDKKKSEKCDIILKYC